MSQQQQSVIEIQSSIDNQKFTVNQHIINSSALLKNICYITDITEPIFLPCSGESLWFFIRLIDNYNQSNNNSRLQDNVQKNNLFKFVSRKQLITLIQELSYLDSDIFFDSVADYILEMFDEHSLDWKDMQEYLGLEDDFTLSERNMILNNKRAEYFLSVGRPDFAKLFKELLTKIFKNYILESLKSIAAFFLEDRKDFGLEAIFSRSLNICEKFRNFNFFKFPFANKNLYSLKTDFATPLNTLMARIIQRSNARTRYLLSLINKTMKNEVDRYPIMMSEFCADRTWWNVCLRMDEFKQNIYYLLNCETFDESYFNALKKRKIISNKVRLNFEEKEPIIQTSFDFVISPHIEITFDRSCDSIYDFDITKCKSSSIYYKFHRVKEEGIKFKELYEHLIAKDFSKEIELFTYDFFNFFSSQPHFRLHKKRNAAKFYLFYMFIEHDEIYPEFKEFVKNYMDDNGSIETSSKIQGIPVNIERINGYYKYPVSVVKKYLELITLG